MTQKRSRKITGEKKTFWCEKIYITTKQRVLEEDKEIQLAQNCVIHLTNQQAGF